jgi:exodeoxyribonuclease-3
MMRLATWNINGLRARLDFVLHWLKSRQPDIVGLQELKIEEDQFPRRVFEAAGYSTLVHSQKAWNGVAILSRDPMELVTEGLPGQEKYGARLIGARSKELSFLTVYCPNGKSVDHSDFPLKLAWFDGLQAFLEKEHSPHKALVLCGDLNLCPSPKDTWNEKVSKGKIFHTPEERERFQSLIDWGLMDLYRNKYPDEIKYSWWDYRGGAFHLNQGLRIDFLLGTEAIVQRVQDVVIDRDYRKKKDGMTTSDHTPVYVDLCF